MPNYLFVKKKIKKLGNILKSAQLFSQNQQL